MKIDLYTKSILTIIAFALVCIVVQNSSNFVQASPPSAPIPTEQGVSIRYHSLTKFNPLPVYIVKDPNKQENTEE